MKLNKWLNVTLVRTFLVVFAFLAVCANAQQQARAEAVSADLFASLFDDSAGMTVAVDSNGAIHVAAATIMQGGDYTVVYGRCAGQCDRGQSWSFVALPYQSSTSFVPTIAL